MIFNIGFYNRGFALLESLIAMAILTIAGLGALKVYSYLEIERANAALWIRANILAKSVISQLQRVNTNFVCADGNVISFEQVESCKIATDENSPFAVKVEVKKVLSVISNTGNDLDFAKILYVLVSWQDRKAQAQQLTMPLAVSIFTNLP